MHFKSAAALLRAPAPPNVDAHQLAAATMWDAPVGRRSGVATGVLATSQSLSAAWNSASVAVEVRTGLGLADGSQTIFMGYSASGKVVSHGKHAKWAHCNNKDDSDGGKADFYYFLPVKVSVFETCKSESIISIIVSHFFPNRLLSATMAYAGSSQ